MWTKIEKKSIVFCLLLAFSGSILGFNLNLDDPLAEKLKLFFASNIEYKIVFFNILFRNLIVGVMLSFIGFLTGGVPASFMAAFSQPILSQTGNLRCILDVFSVCFYQDVPCQN